MSSFYKLKISKIINLTDDAVEIFFDIPLSNSKNFTFLPGQYITIKKYINGTEIRRSYSICSSPNSGNLSIGVKLLDGGIMSTYLCNQLSEGEILEIMPPQGNFVLSGKKSLAICSGSGITPILSMIESNISDFTLIYGNKTIHSTMFYNRIIEKDIIKHLVFSKEDVEGCHKGRIDDFFLDKFDNFSKYDSIFICGPGDMIDNVSSYLITKGIEKSKIKFEKFFSSNVNKSNIQNSQKNEILSELTIVVDGDEFEYKLSSNGESILDSAMNQGIDVPYSCKGGVCCTCKAKVMEGEAIMTENFALSEEEVEDGFILTCKAHPKSQSLVVDFDEM
tara:strand:+ start:14651 stop:15655 length:1005 start_codon:yes stop_codon:yes gene_type:complete